MSYCRDNGIDSDVYVICISNGKRPIWECVGCSLDEDRCCDFETRAGMMVHLTRHTKAGHKVPLRAFERLAREIAENDE